MRYRLLTVLAIAALTSPVTVQGQDTGPVKYWVFFDSKPATTESSKQVQRAEITERAIERRAVKSSSTRISYLDRDVSPDYLAKLDDLNVTVLTRSRWLNAISTYLDAETLSRVRDLPFVREIRPVGQTKPLSHNPTPLVFEQSIPPVTNRFKLDYGASVTQLNTVNAVAPLERGINGTGVLVGILDTEFDGFTHGAFAQMIADSRLVGYQNFSQGTQSNRHGMYVASIMIGFDEGNLIGPAYGANFIAATTEYAPTETNQEEDAWVAGLEWLESQGADVVNSSLGYNEFDAGQNSYTYSDLDGNTATTTIAADIAVSLGVVVVNSAGNDGCNSPAQCWYYVATPADGDSVIAVGSVSSSGVKSGFSSFGPTSDGRIKPDVAAMGEGVVFAIPGSAYAAGNGTSFAAPMVAGVVAQMLQVNPLLTPIEVRQMLRDSGSQSTSPDNQLGWGIIDADAAVLQAQIADVVPGETPRQSASIRFYPNPVSERATFVVTPKASGADASLYIYDLLGRHIETIWEGTITAGTSISWSPANLADGIYVYRFESDSEIVSGSLIIVQE